MPVSSSANIKGGQQAVERLKFLKGNAKLGSDVWTFSIPAGHTCPGACQCKAKVDRQGGKLVDGPQTQFRCFSATQEVAFRSVRQSRWSNMDLLKPRTSVPDLMDLIVASVPNTAEIIRVHVSGDFYSQNYFDAWMYTADLFGHVKFYAYTKSIPFWLGWHSRYGDLPSNFMLTASEGGRFDSLIEPWMTTASVVFHPEEAEAKGLEIDHDDSHAQNPEKDFALLIHGVGAKGSEHSQALKRLKEEGITFSYARD
jgi:Gene product 88